MNDKIQMILARGVVLALVAYATFSMVTTAITLHSEIKHAKEEEAEAVADLTEAQAVTAHALSNLVVDGGCSVNSNDLSLAGNIGMITNMFSWTNAADWDLETPISLTICGGGSTEVTISWDAGIMDVEISEDATLTEAAEAFFNFLERYIKSEYDIVPKNRTVTTRKGADNE